MRKNQLRLTFLGLLVALFLCAQVEAAEEKSGYASWPLPALIVVFLFMLCMTAMFCGLTIGLLGMDTINLEIVAEAGPSPDCDYAKKIIPIRKLGHHLLATLLLGNMLTLVLVSQLVAAIVNSTELVNFIVGTLILLIFGEILPMSFCNNEKYGLWAGAKSLPALKISIFILYPIAKPLGMMLDCLVSHDAGQIYDREEFKKLIRVHWEKYSEKSGLDAEQLRMMLGALDAKEVTISDVMTPMDKMFMLDANEILGAELQRKLWEYGKSRVPVYMNTEDNIVGVLYVRDLICVPVLSGDYTTQTVKDFIAEHPRDLLVVSSATKLTSALTVFLSGNTQLIFVEKEENPKLSRSHSGEHSDTNSQKDSKTKKAKHSHHHGSEDEQDEEEMEEVVSAKILSAKNLLRFEEPKNAHQFVGVITMEDVIERIISQEIYDEDEYDLELKSDGEESDVSVAYVSTARRPRRCPRINFYSFGPPTAPAATETVTELTDDQKWVLADYLTRTFVFFATWKVQQVKFLLDEVKDTIVWVKKGESENKHTTLYTYGMATTAFTFILGGEVRLLVGPEKFSTIVSSFSSLGEEVFSSTKPFVPDYSADITENTRYLCITQEDIRNVEKKINEARAKKRYKPVSLAVFGSGQPFADPKAPHSSQRKSEDTRVVIKS